MRHYFTNRLTTKFSDLAVQTRIREQARIEIEQLRKGGNRGDIVSHAFDVPGFAGELEFLLRHVDRDCFTTVEIDLSGGWVDDGNPVERPRNRAKKSGAATH